MKTIFGVQPASGAAHKAAKTFRHSFKWLFAIQLGLLSIPFCSFAQTLPTYQPAMPERLRSNLYLLNSDGSKILADGVLSDYNNAYHNAVTLEDAVKFTNINENLGIIRNSVVLSVERRPVITVFDTIFFKLWKTTVRDYQLTLTADNLNHPDLEAVLVDKYLATNTPLALYTVNTYNFSITSDVASQDPDRFMVVFRPLGWTPVPVTFSSIRAYQQNDKIKVDWKVENEVNMTGYEVEKSANGVDFNTIATVNAGNVSIAGYYSITDGGMFTGNNFYRIKCISASGNSKYSTVVKIFSSKSAGSISLYPNPVKGNNLNLQLANQPAGTYLFNLVNSSGQMVYSEKMQVNAGNSTRMVNTQKALAPGIYQVEIIRPDNSKSAQKLVVQ